MLSNLLINKTKPQAKTLRLSDGRGMYLEICKRSIFRTLAGAKVA